MSAFAIRRRAAYAGAALAVAGAAAIAMHAWDVQASSKSSPVVRRTMLGALVSPVGVKGRTLGLFRVVIPAHAQLALHYHPGAQIAYVQEGVLTYSVRNGFVDVMRGAADASPRRVRRIGAGQTGQIRAGQWLVEVPSDIHAASNPGNKRVVVLLATLLKTGAPPAIPVK
jgi:quercetin dioxygenase-like cupin family protein